MHKKNSIYIALLVSILLIGTLIPGTFADGDPYLAGFLEGMSPGATAADDYHLDEATVNPSEAYWALMHMYPEGFPDGSREFVFFFIESSDLETQSCQIGLRANADYLSYEQGIDPSYNPEGISYATIEEGEIFFYPNVNQYIGLVSAEEETCTLAVRFRDSTIFEDLTGLIMIGDGEEDDPSEEVLSEAVSCLDSDGGQDYETQGTMLREDEEFVDYCLGNDLVEYFCAGGLFDDSGEEIHEYHRTCPEACFEGACVDFEALEDELEGEELETDARDSLVASCVDEGDNEFLFESVRVYDEEGDVVEYFDGCSSDAAYVSQFYCQHEEFPSLPYDSVDSRQSLCEFGCVEGVCLSESPVGSVQSQAVGSCEESDGGFVLSEQGEVVADDLLVVDHCVDFSSVLLDQEVASSELLKEYWCEDDQLLETIYGCDCVDGACVELREESGDSETLSSEGSDLELDGASQATFIEQIFGGLGNFLWGDTGIFVRGVNQDTKSNSQSYSGRDADPGRRLRKESDSRSARLTDDLGEDPYCHDTDGGIEFKVLGEISSPSYDAVDSCGMDGHTLTEFYCSEDGPEYTLTDCQFGCEEGICLSGSFFARVAGFFGSSRDLEESEEPFLTCLDSDGGENLFAQGTTEFELGTDSELVDSGSWVDSCYSESEVIEHVCTRDSAERPIASFVEPCPSGFSCQEGACVSDSAEALDCRDFDGGENLLIASYVETSTGRQEDSCASAYQVTEWICNNNPGFEGAVGLVEDCADGFVCYEGACVIPESASSTMTSDDSDSSSTSSMKGSSKGSSGFFARLFGAESSSSKVSLESFETECSSLDDSVCSEQGLVCLQGTCVDPVSCVDTDTEGVTASMGIAAPRYELGTVTVEFEGGSEEFVDTCANPLTIVEYHCSQGAIPVRQEVSCPPGDLCSEGACERATSCVETDSGADLAVAGESVGPLLTTGVVRTLTDECLADGRISEAYCSSDGQHLLFQEQSCPEGTSCFDGACI